MGVVVSGFPESKTRLNPIKHSINMAVGIPMKVKAVIIQKHAVAAFVTKQWLIHIAIMQTWSNMSCNVINEDV